MGKTVLVTGASRGIGEAVARLFYENGYNVIINYNSSENAAKKLCEELPGSIAIRADVSNEDNVKNMILTSLNHFGKIDVLVNNAGIAGANLVTDITEQEWQRIFDVNVKGTFFVTKHTLPDMINRKKGKIINVSSMWGITGASCESCYSASKGAIIAFTKSLAKELGCSGINVNCVAPGFIDTEMNSNISEEDRVAFCDELPLGRMGTAYEVAQAILFLASDGADYITGQVLSPDGGAVI